MIKLLDKILIAMVFIAVGSAFTVGNFLLAIGLGALGNYLLDRYNINYPAISK